MPRPKAVAAGTTEETEHAESTMKARGSNPVLDEKPSVASLTASEDVGRANAGAARNATHVGSQTQEQQETSHMLDHKHIVGCHLQEGLELTIFSL